jgi:hypothetical protein
LRLLLGRALLQPLLSLLILLLSLLRLLLDPLLLRYLRFSRCLALAKVARLAHSTGRLALHGGGHLGLSSHRALARRIRPAPVTRGLPLRAGLWLVLFDALRQLLLWLLLRLLLGRALLQPLLPLLLLLLRLLLLRLLLGGTLLRLLLRLLLSRDLGWRLGLLPLLPAFGNMVRAIRIRIAVRTILRCHHDNWKSQNPAEDNRFQFK